MMGPGSMVQGLSTRTRSPNRTPDGIWTTEVASYTRFLLPEALKRKLRVGPDSTA